MLTNAVREWLGRWPPAELVACLTYYAWSWVSQPVDSELLVQNCVIAEMWILYYLYLIITCFIISCQASAKQHLSPSSSHAAASVFLTLTWSRHFFVKISCKSDFSSLPKGPFTLTSFLVPVAGASQLAPVNWRVCHATGTRISLVPVTGTNRC